ncbi:MacS family sensor histidine kinase [Micromonospora sp. NPDC050187]|uniref:MacS family sensor histidine kinase n=1 Tax=Micromonospora sp. NPDC050187 TaxID=3364277 RepID=UPI0037956A4E
MPTPSGGLEVPLWRAIAVYRVAALGYACVVVLRDLDRYTHPLAAWPVLAAMAGWTAFTAYAYARPARRGWPLLAADLGVVLGILLLSPGVVGRAALAAGVPALAVAWLGGPVLAWAVSGGRRRGAAAALVLGTGDLVVRGWLTPSALNGAVLLLLAGVVVGHVARLAVTAGQRLQRAVELEAATRERERLARDIHDSVLQVLALVQRRGVHLDGEAGELARLAGEQEAALRALIATGPPAHRLPSGPAASGSPSGPAGPGSASGPAAPGSPSVSGPSLVAASRSGPVGWPVDLTPGWAGAGPPGSTPAADGTRDLRDLLRRFAGPAVSVAAPATTVPLPEHAAKEMAAAVAAALDNVARHADGRAWVLLEDEGTLVRVSVRDAGPGIPPGRLDEAAAQGRLGVAQSIRGRLADLGGSTTITAVPGEGTEIELVLPRS